MSLIENMWNKIIFCKKRVNVGSNVKIRGFIFVHGRKNGVKIGNNSIINSAAVYNPTSGFQHTHLSVGNGGYINIGSNVGISNANITA